VATTRFIITDADAGERLDKLIAARRSRSRAEVRALLEAGAVFVNDRRIAPRGGGQQLGAGDVVEVVEPDDALLDEAPPPLRVLAEGGDWVAVDKPAGLPVHPLRADERGTLLHAVAAAYPAVRGVNAEGPLRCGVVHRLDVPTSGVVLFALTKPRYAALRDAFTAHRVDKRYRAVVACHVWPQSDHVDLPLAVVRHRPAHVAVVASGHAEARATSLDYTVIEADAIDGRPVSRVDVTLHTGFLHQVRVTLAHRGHPVLGDHDYGDAWAADATPRLMLHAWRIAVDDIAAESPLPVGFGVT
jgi:23S rRNA pseudouridine1911/1915/1917 synthase